MVVEFFTKHRFYPNVFGKLRREFSVRPVLTVWESPSTTPAVTYCSINRARSLFKIIIIYYRLLLYDIVHKAGQQSFKVVAPAGDKGAVLFLGVLQYILLFVPKNFAALRAAFFVINIIHCYTVCCHCSAPQAKNFGLGLVSFEFPSFLEQIEQEFYTFCQILPVATVYPSTYDIPRKQKTIY